MELRLFSDNLTATFEDLLALQIAEKLPILRISYAMGSRKGSSRTRSRKTLWRVFLPEKTIPREM